MWGQCCVKVRQGKEKKKRQLINSHTVVCTLEPKHGTVWFHVNPCLVVLTQISPYRNKYGFRYPSQVSHNYETCGYFETREAVRRNARTFLPAQASLLFPLHVKQIRSCHVLLPQQSCCLTVVARLIFQYCSTKIIQLHPSEIYLNTFVTKLGVDK